MDAGSQFERLIRMVQETGERMVVSLDPGKDPVVLLPFSLYEQLVAGGRQLAPSVSERRPSGVSDTVNHRSVPAMPQPSPHIAPSRTPFVPSEDMVLDPVDAWDGEGGEEYDAERIFASAALGKEFSPSDRLKASVSRASEAYGAMQPEGWREGSGGQRLPIRGSSLRDEERFSLGMG